MKGNHLLAIGCLSAVVLSGCGGSGEDEIQQWMQEQRNQARPKVTPIPAPKQFKPEAYTNVTATEPFSNLKLMQALKRETKPGGSDTSLLDKEKIRRKEPLEAWPLDSMSLVGSILKEGQPVALIKVDNLLYQVKPGNYLGQNYGLVKKVSETEVVLREIVQDAAGEWIERMTTLQLQEGKK